MMKTRKKFHGRVKWFSVVFRITIPWLSHYALSSLAPQNSLVVVPTMHINAILHWDLLWMSQKAVETTCFSFHLGLMWSNDQNWCFLVRVSLLDISITNLPHLLGMQQIHWKGWEGVGIFADKANSRLRGHGFKYVLFPPPTPFFGRLP